MKSSRRNKFDIIEEILSIAKIGVGKTAIIYQANLNHTSSSKYIHSLLDKGFLKIEEDSSKYTTTEKGLQLLKNIRELKKEFKG